MCNLNKNFRPTKNVIKIQVTVCIIKLSPSKVNYKFVIFLNNYNNLLKTISLIFVYKDV